MKEQKELVHQPTKNQRGCMHPLSPFSNQFCLFAKNKVVADLGCAYGNVSLAALKTGAKQVVACDMESEHLKHVAKVADTDGLIDRLALKQGVFPKHLELPTSSLDGVYASHVLEYLSGPEMGTGLAKLFSWLKPGGKVFLLVYTIYIHELNNPTFKQAYQARREAGDRWPGYLENYDDYCTPEEKDASPVETNIGFPSNLHMFELQVLETALLETGFKVESAEYLDGKEHHAVPETYDSGKELLGIIACKP